MQKKKNPTRNREKDRNFAGLYAVSHEYAYKNGKLRPEVYGYVTKNLRMFVNRLRSKVNHHNSNTT